MPHSFALLRTRLTARCASLSGPAGGTPFSSPGRRGQRYFRMMPVMPIGVEPLGDLGALDIPAEVVIPAAGADEHRDAGVLLLRGPVDADRRLRDVGEPLRRLAVDLVGLSLDHQLEELLLADLRGVVVRRLPGPDVDDEGLVSR